ncbi:MAG: response regulator [Deltaproteobacteria bacterium]|nr:response regulator [Deltaproteobacteria bacterium]
MKRIAIADDDKASMLVLKGLIQECGYSVVAEASNGAAAIEACVKDKPDLIIMDVGMPVKDGIAAAADINRISPTPVVILTAKDDEDTVRRAIEAGVMGYLVKPVRLEELAPAIELAISRFFEWQAVRKENLDLKTELASRKTIEKAKGLLMAKEGMTENEAFTRLRKVSMDRRKTMVEIAEVIILAFEKKGG